MYMISRREIVSLTLLASYATSYTVSIITYGSFRHTVCIMCWFTVAYLMPVYHWKWYKISTKVHSPLCYVVRNLSIARASEQVSDRFVGVYDKLTTFQVAKPVSDRIALSRHVVIVLAGSRQVRCVFVVMIDFHQNWHGRKNPEK